MLADRDLQFLRGAFDRRDDLADALDKRVGALEDGVEEGHGFRAPPSRLPRSFAKMLWPLQAA